MGSLKKFAFTLLAIAFASAAPAHSAPDLLFNYHFVGTTDLFKDTNTATLKKIWDLPDSGLLREGVLNKLARTPEQIVASEGGGKSEAALLLRPLLNDLLEFESMAEVRRATNNPGEVVIAVRLSKDRVPLWETNLQKVVATFTGSKPQLTQWEKYNGWEVTQKNATPNIIRSIWTGEWLVLGIGQTELPLQNNLLRRLSSGKTPGEWKGHTNWLESTIDFPRLQGWLPLSRLPFKLASTQVELSNRDGNIRTVLRAVYPESLNWNAEKWQVPTNIVRDPLISFTAAQNLAALITNPDVLTKTGYNPLTNQFFIWAHGQIPFMTFAAMPVKNSEKAFDQLSDRLPHLFNDTLQRRKFGTIVFSTNKEEIVWNGLSLITPKLVATNESAGQFIFASLFPTLPSKEAPPQALIEQVTSQTNLIYYDWEITQNRLGQWQMLSKMFPMLTPRRSKASPGQFAEAKTNETLRAELSMRMVHERWQSKVAPFLGNTITEVKQVGPNEIELVRRSHIGFTGIELIYLSNRLNDPRFPMFKEETTASHK